MRRTRVRLATLPILIGILVIARPAHAQLPEAAATHLRPDPGLRPLLADAVRRSPTVRDLVERLERSDVTVYIRVGRFADSTLHGRVTLVSRTSLQRFL